MEFEWDEAKAASNIGKHKVTLSKRPEFSFDRGIFALKYDRSDQQTMAKNVLSRLGWLDGNLYHVTYTERGERIRIISARKATKVKRAIL